jgi:hypothetical protein
MSNLCEQDRGELIQSTLGSLACGWHSLWLVVVFLSVVGQCGLLRGSEDPSPTSVKQPEGWLQERFLKIHMELNVPNRRDRIVGERFDASAFQEAIRASHVQVVTIFAKDAYGNSFFHTQHGYFDPGLKFDLVKAQVEALHALGIKVLTHYSVGDDSHIDLFHPDWICQDNEGKPIGAVLSNQTCLNSPYREEMLLPQLEELARLGLDGLWLDIWGPPPECFCQYCRRKFRERYGTELTPLDSHRFQFWWESWEEALADVNRRVRAINPDIAITWNGANLRDQARRGLVNFFTSESHVNRRTGYEDHQIQARYLRPLGVPFDIQNMTNVERWDDSTLKHAVQLEVEFSQAVAQGGRISAGTQLYPWGEYELAGAKVLGQAYQFIEDRLPYVRGARTAAYAAVLTPDGRPGEGFAKITSDQGLIGTLSALTQQHVQFDILEGANGGYELLANYQLAIIPQPEATFQERAGRMALEQFLKGGGKLLLISNGKAPSRDFLHALGLQVQSQQRKAVRGQLRGRGQESGFPFQGDLVTLEGPGVTSVVSLQSGGEEWLAVSLLSKQIGYIAWPLGRDFYETGYPEWRGFLGEALSSLRLDVPYEVQGPANLDVNLMERQGEYLLHIVNASIQKGLPGLMPQVWDVAPVYDIQVTVRCPRPSDVSLEPGGQKLAFSYDGVKVHFRVPEVHVYEIARIHWE